MQISNVSFVYFNCDYICNNLNTGNPFFSAFQINISVEHCKKRIYQKYKRSGEYNRGYYTDEYVCGNTFLYPFYISCAKVLRGYYRTTCRQSYKKSKCKKFNELVEPTAASLISPSVCPTIKVSTTLYNSCKRFPIITGIAKSKIWLNIFPCVRFRTDLELAIDMHTYLLKIIAENKL